MSLTVCFHHDDADGRGSGAVVRYALGKDVHLIEIDYDRLVIPWDLIEKADKVVVTDFSFPVDWMKKLADGREFIWIDHHISAMKEFDGIADQWPGLRDTNESACVNAWKYFFPNRPVPRAIVLIGDRDIWRWAEKDTGAFNEAINARDFRVENDDLWVPLLEDDPELLKEMLIEGARLREIRLNDINHMIERRGYEVKFFGERTLVVNTSGNGDIGQRSRDLGYEIAYCYYDRMELGVLSTGVTLFSREADVSVIAKKFGGGGHEHAAGFSFPRGDSPFPPGADVQFLKEEK